MLQGANWTYPEPQDEMKPWEGASVRKHGKNKGEKGEKKRAQAWLESGACSW